MQRNSVFNNPVVSECIDYLSFPSHNQVSNLQSTRCSTTQSTTFVPSLTYNLRSSTRRLNNKDQCNENTEIATKKRKISVLEDEESANSNRANELGEGGSGFQLTNQNVTSTKNDTITTPTNALYRTTDSNDLFGPETNSSRVLRVTTRRIASRTNLPAPPALVQPSSAMANRDPIMPNQIVAPRAAISPALDPNYTTPPNTTLEPNRTEVSSIIRDYVSMIRNNRQFVFTPNNGRRIVYVRRRQTTRQNQSARLSVVNNLNNPEFYFTAMLMMQNRRSDQVAQFEDYQDWFELSSLFVDAMPRGLSKSEIESLVSFRYDAGIHGGRHCRDEDTKMCVVCLEEFVHRQKLRVLPCSHDFHAKCVDKWLKTNRLCPICRQDANIQPSPQQN